MARATRKPSRGKSGGSTLFGLLAGVIIGLAAAVAVALFVTKAPMPFVDKASREPEKVALPDVRTAPDPNSGLNNKGQPTPPVTSPAGVPPDAGANSMAEDIDRLIASLNQAERNGAGQAAAPAQSPAAGQRQSPPAGATAPAARPAGSAPAAQTPPASTQTTYYLQAGAFRTEADAEAMKARLLMLGMTAFVQKAQVDGTTWHRVRLGPFRGIDDMNRSRAQLGEERIASTVVRP